VAAVEPERVGFLTCVRLAYMALHGNPYVDTAQLSRTTTTPAP